MGRYHTPHGIGRIRDLETDPDILIKTKAIIKDKKIENIEKILIEISNNQATHGEGALYASIISNISFEKAYKYGKSEQKRGGIPYGPFIRSGTNCSRFVATIIKKSGAPIIKSLRLSLPYCISPSPKRNITIDMSQLGVVTIWPLLKYPETIIHGDIQYRDIITFTNYNSCMPYVQYNGIKYATITRMKYVLYRAVVLRDIIDRIEFNPDNYECMLDSIVKLEAKLNLKYSTKSKFRKNVYKCDGDELNKIVTNLINMTSEKEELLKQTQFLLDYPEEGLMSKIYPTPKGDIKLPYAGFIIL
mgnify:CR=1 FL=1